MSKIEEALRRARTERSDRAAVGEAPAAAGAAAVRPRPVAARTRRINRDKQLVGLTAAEEIAHMREPFARSRADLCARRIIDKDAVDSPVADAFRHLRTQLFQQAGDRNFVLMVTSAARDGGSSFVARNLAASIAFDEGRTALIVDCNLREPSCDELLESPDEAAGITDYLAGEESKVENILHPVGIPRVRLVPSGRQPRAAMEYFTSPRLGELMAELRGRYRERYIIVDAPPISEAADGRILAELCDMGLLVVPYGRVSTSQVATAAAAIGEEKFVGCVLNNEPRAPGMGGASG